MIYLTEVGPRDGLQNEREIIPTATKIAFIDALSESGVQEIEVSSFVSPRWVPQLADAREVFAGITRNPKVAYSALVPNEKGFDRALECEPDRVAVFAAVSETFSQKNINTSVAGSFERFAPIMPRARKHGIPVRGYLSTVFYCPFEGRQPVSRVVEIAEHLLDMGCVMVALGDTVGRATPDHTRAVLEAVLSKIPAAKVAMHFHDTFGTAAENVKVSLEMGITHFDSSVGGLGGCPYAGPGAPGNVATETVVRTIRDAGYEVPVDLDKLAAGRDLINRAMLSAQSEPT